MLRGIEETHQQHERREGCLVGIASVAGHRDVRVCLCGRFFGNQAMFRSIFLCPRNLSWFMDLSEWDQRGKCSCITKHHVARR